jgi:DNA-binding NarL/FixJ family response regulator
MLVVAEEQRREEIRAAIARLVPDARVEIARSGVDALLRSAQSQATDLLVLDLAVDGASGPALTRHLARIGQATAVLVFGDDAERRPSTTGTVWSWNDIDLALQRWSDGRRG